MFTGSLLGSKPLFQRSGRVNSRLLLFYAQKRPMLYGFQYGGDEPVLTKIIVHFYAVRPTAVKQHRKFYTFQLLQVKKCKNRRIFGKITGE